MKLTGIFQDARLVSGKGYLLTLLSVNLGQVGTEEKLSLEQLHSNHCEYKLEEDKDNQNVENIFQRVNNTVEHRLKDLSSWE